MLGSLKDQLVGQLNDPATDWRVSSFKLNRWAKELSRFALRISKRPCIAYVQHQKQFL
jgi:hypothetical protein